jgi:zinc transport system substrate-binding protein
MKNRTIMAILGIIVILTLVALVKVGPRPTGTAGKLAVTATFYPMAEFARQVGGDRVAVTTMVRPGVEPHDYEPSPGDLTGLYRSQLFVYNGAGLEQWVPRIQAELAAGHITVVDASTGVPTLGSDSSPESGTDPHLWLDPVRAAAQVGNIEAGLVRADPAHAQYYHERAAAYRDQLAKLGQAYRVGLEHCTRHDVVASHRTLGYLADRYGFNALAIAGLSPESEPPPQKLAGIAAFIQAHELKYIFFEKLVSPKLAQTLAHETGAQTLVFDPLEGLAPQAAAHGQNYLTIQQANLNNLRLALNCN